MHVLILFLIFILLIILHLHRFPHSSLHVSASIPTIRIQSQMAAHSKARAASHRGDVAPISAAVLFVCFWQFSTRMSRKPVQVQD